MSAVMVSMWACMAGNAENARAALERTDLEALDIVQAFEIEKYKEHPDDPLQPPTMADVANSLAKSALT